MTTLADILNLEDSGWGYEEIIREVEIRRGLGRLDAQRWFHATRYPD